MKFHCNYNFKTKLLNYIYGIKVINLIMFLIKIKNNILNF